MNLLRLRSDDDGVAMLTALLAVVILSGMALVFMNRANTETRVSANSRDHEAAIHVSEAASDRQIAAANIDDDHVTYDRDGNRIEVDPASIADDEAWAMSLLDVMRPDEVTGVASDAWTQLEGGESFAVRPYDTAADEPLDVVYAVGAVPSFDAPNAKVRVIKLQIAQDHYVPEFALLTGAPLKFGGSASILVPGCDPAGTEAHKLEHCNADVHTNQDFENPGNSSTVQGRVSQTVGACPGGGGVAVNGCVDASHGVVAKEIPEFRARNFYNRGDDLNPDPLGQSVAWFDLCPPGKPVPGQATVRESGAEPCLASSPQIWSSADGNDFRGWQWQGGQHRWRGSEVGAGVFYIYHADGRIEGSAESPTQRAVSVLVEQDPANKANSGALRIRGNPQLQSALESVLFITDTDLSMHGTGSAGTCGVTPSGFSGFMGVGEQFDVSGNVQLRGALIAQDREDEHALVRRHNASVQGNMCLEYDENLAVDFLGIWVITYWNEL